MNVDNSDRWKEVVLEFWIQRVTGNCNKTPKDGSKFQAGLIF